MKPDDCSIVGRIEEREVGPDEIGQIKRLEDLDARLGIQIDRRRSKYVAIFRVPNQTYESKVRLKNYDPNWSEPVVADFSGESDLWLFRGRVIKIEPQAIPLAEIKLKIMYFVGQYAQNLERMKREIEARQKLQNELEPTRERIPEAVRIFVWQRDQGRCVQCGGRYKLEFDHIIPVVEGGSSTERNVQLLCETCNRQKGSKV